MTAVAWVFLVAWLVTGLLLAIAIGGNADLTGQNRRLRHKLAKATQHPSIRLVPSLNERDETFGWNGGAS